jgi:uncharacterized RDD family membrane protein YckC
MAWYYADNGRQVGPIEEPALDELVHAGVVRDDTLVWREGMANWQPHSAVRGSRTAQPLPPVPPAPAAAGNAYCSECGRPFPPDQLLNLGTASVCAQCKPIYLQRVREGGQAIGARRYAGFWIRFVALIIDGIILGVVNFIVTIPFGILTAGAALSGDPTTLISAGLGLLGMRLLIGAALNLAYSVYFISTRGATPGKMVLNLKVIRSDGSPVSAGRAAGRYFAQVLSGMILFIGYIIAAFDSEKRALHDHLADTRVIYTR